MQQALPVRCYGLFSKHIVRDIPDLLRDSGRRHHVCFDKEFLIQAEIHKVGLP